jgi:hypothetical protein
MKLRSATPGLGDSLGSLVEFQSEESIRKRYSGHEHNSQIRPERDVQGRVVSQGGWVRIVAGGGGAGLYAFASSPDDATPQWGYDSDYALLRLTLRDQDWTADFISKDGKLLLLPDVFPRSRLA